MLVFNMSFVTGTIISITGMIITIGFQSGIFGFLITMDSLFCFEKNEVYHAIL